VSNIYPDQCGWCVRRIVGRHRLAEPFAFRGWAYGQPIRLAVPLAVPLVFQRRCWRSVKAIAAAAETWGGDLPADPPLTYCDDCGADTYPATDHHCPGGVMPA